MKINVAIAVTGFTIVKIPPIIDKTPIPRFIPLKPVETCFETAPTITREIPVTINAKPRNITKRAVVTSGFEITNPANPMAIAPKIISDIRIPFEVFSRLTFCAYIGIVINLIKISLDFNFLLYEANMF